MIPIRFPQQLELRRRFMQAGILATFALIPVWRRLLETPSLFAELYVTRFLIFMVMVWTVGWWLVAGLPGFAFLRRDKRRRLWTLPLLLLALWAFASNQWAFTSTDPVFRSNFRPEVAMSASLQFGVVALFAVVVASVRPSTHSIVTVMIFGVAWNAVVAILQAANQGAIGLQGLGEFPLDINDATVSIIEAGGRYFLRPYGLLPHPNMLGGFFALALPACFVWIASGRRLRRRVGALIFIGGLAGLLLTFSRASWLGFAAGVVPILGVWFRRRERPVRLRRRTVVVLGALLAVVGLVFAVLFGPLLAARMGIGAELAEVRSVQERVVLFRYALRSIRESPLIGVGVGNFAWRASYYLTFTDLDMRGDHVHNVYLLVWAELGIIGFTLMLAALSAGLWLGFRTLRRKMETSRLVLFSGMIALLVIGLLDHYPWTTIQFQTAWWGLLAAIPTGDDATSSDAESPPQSEENSGAL